MSVQPATPPPRSYGCTFGDGNPYDYILISVVDGSCEMVCLPCFVRLARDMLAAMLNPDDPEVLKAIALLNNTQDEQAPGPSGKRRGHNAPATNEDPALFDSFESVMTVDDLPDDFK